MSCTRKGDEPQAVFDHARAAIRQGDLKRAQDEAHRAAQHFQHSSPEWALKFKTLEANSLLQQGLYEDSLKLLKSEPLDSQEQGEVIQILLLEGEADTQTHNFPEADLSLDKASTLCAGFSSKRCGYVLKAEGLLASERNQWALAERFFGLALDFAQTHDDAVLKANALVSLGYSALSQGHFDEAIDRSEEAYRAAQAAGSRRFELVSHSNTAWAHYRLGNYEKALQMASDAKELASQLGDVSTEADALRNIGNIYTDERKYDRAAQAFHECLALAKGTNAREDIYNNLRVLARLSLETADLPNASQYAQQALDMAQKDNNHIDEIYPLLLQAQIASRRGDTASAEKTFQQIDRDPATPVSLKWEAEHSLARLYEDEGINEDKDKNKEEDKDENKKPRPDSARLDLADREYRVALATFEDARGHVKREDSQLSFLTNASRIYDDYVHFLVARGQPQEALRWADNSRARTLKEGLGLLTGSLSDEDAKKHSSDHAALRNPQPPPLNPRQIAHQAGGTILFYWLGERQSYLWAITPQKTSLFTLPPGAEIESAAARYRQALNAPQEPLEAGSNANLSANLNTNDGRWLYRTLVAPAAETLKKDAKVYVVPDGGLNNLNFDTLIVDANAETNVGNNVDQDANNNVGKKSDGKVARPHYWIEDADILNASSLLVLADSFTRAKNVSHKLLLIGDGVSPSKDYPELPRAAAQMAAVASHFPANARQVLDRERATPQAFLNAHPEQFSHIHFVAHGTANRLSPLDSAIILSNNKLVHNAAATNPGTPDSFKLYARAIKPHSLRANLVTISACYSAGDRFYSGEGLVGLAWAFLRAGAHNVIAASWEVTDASTERLMNTLYDELNRGATPDAALRNAKLAMLRSNTAFHKPFYWAPFQLYVGS